MKITSKPSFEEEITLWNKGIEHVIGIDEVGRGAFAGPIVAAAVVYPPSFKFENPTNINDSKLLRHKERETLCSTIKQNALAWSIAEVDVKFINKFGIGKANITVFRKCLSEILKQIQNESGKFFLLIDGFHGKYLPGGLTKQKAIVKGDQKSLTIASASILAKVHRDKLMISYARKFTFYNFGENKGYGTKFHQNAISQYGLSPIHRTSFKLEKFRISLS